MTERVKMTNQLAELLSKPEIEDLVSGAIRKSIVSFLPAITADVIKTLFRELNNIKIKEANDDLEEFIPQSTYEKELERNDDIEKKSEKPLPAFLMSTTALKKRISEQKSGNYLNITSGRGCKAERAKTQSKLVVYDEYNFCANQNCPRIDIAIKLLKKTVKKVVDLNENVVKQKKRKPKQIEDDNDLYISDDDVAEIITNTLKMNTVKKKVRKRFKLIKIYEHF